MRKLPFAALLTTLALSPAWPHHSAAVYYQLDKQVTVEGVVTRVELGNPHVRIYVNVKRSDGTDNEWVAEGGSRSALLRKGWTGEEVRPGDALTVFGNPARDGSNVVHWQRLSRADGTQLWSEGSPVLDELRPRPNGE